jgi:hypothetical protein
VDVLGPGVLAVTAMYIYVKGTDWHTATDHFFFITLAAMVIGRWLEVLGGHPLTSVDEPAMRKDFYRYVVVVLIAGAGLWILVNTFGNQGRVS